MATLVVLFHSWWVSPGAKSYDFVFSATGYQVTLGRFAVMMFFGMSGFLIAGSWERSKSVFLFFKARILRIFPALILVTLVTILFIGPIVTSDHDYWNKGETWRYMLNLLLFQPKEGQRYLPGVFEHNHLPREINPSLWTLGYEFACYISLAILGMLRILGKNSTIFILITLVALNFMGLIAPSAGYFLFMSFYMGALLYFLPCIKLNSVFFWLICAAMFVICLYENHMSLWMATFCVYIAITIGKSDMLSSWSRLSDPSYGIYIWSMPMQQLVIYYNTSGNQWINLLMALALTVPISYMSWYMVEKPAIKLKNFSIK